MKNSLFCLGAVLIFLTTVKSYSQEPPEVSLVKDLLLIAEDFASPAAQGAAYQSGAGWFSSAKNLEKWQVEIALHANILFISENKKRTTILSSDYTTFDIREGQRADIPTAFGGKTGVVFEGEIYGEPFEFNAIEGVSRNNVPHPFIQLSVGVPLETEVSFRILPKIEFDNVQFYNYGIALKHNINQYFQYSYPHEFQFSALVAYSKFYVNYMFSPWIIEEIAELDQIEVDANLWLFQFVVSKSFMDSNWEIFAAPGVMSSGFDYKMGGSGSVLPQINTALQTLHNNEVGIKGDIGFNYKAGGFMLSNMFSIGEFFNYNLGIHYRF